MNLEFSEKANLPTHFGIFNVIAFKEYGKHEEHCVIFKGDLQNLQSVPIRIHSECLTGDVFASLKCDCGNQLTQSLDYISKNGKGAIIYLRQEGRGIGLFNKINAYSLQDKGQNTIEANHSLGFDTDLRSYEIVTIVLQYLQIKSVVVLSNNPDKINTLQNSGIIVNGIVPVITEPTVHNIDYLKIKKEQLNHFL